MDLTFPWSFSTHPEQVFKIVNLIVMPCLKVYQDLLFRSKRKRRSKISSIRERRKKGKNSPYLPLPQNLMTTHGSWWCQAVCDAHSHNTLCSGCVLTRTAPPGCVLIHTCSPTVWNCVPLLCPSSFQRGLQNSAHAQSCTLSFSTLYLQFPSTNQVLLNIS